MMWFTVQCNSSVKAVSGEWLSWNTAPHNILLSLIPWFIWPRSSLRLFHRFLLLGGGRSLWPGTAWRHRSVTTVRNPGVWARSLTWAISIWWQEKWPTRPTWRRQNIGVVFISCPSSRISRTMGGRAWFVVMLLSGSRILTFVLY